MSTPVDAVGPQALVDEALADLEPLASRSVDLAAAAGCVLAETVDATSDLPLVDVALIDGYAVRAADVAAADADSPVLVRVVAEVATAGGDALTSRPGIAVRIMAGGRVPAGADAVLPLASTDGNDHEVIVTAPVAEGHGLRHRGALAAAGDTLLEAGAQVGPAAVALLAADGRARVEVIPRPRVAVLPVGDELLPVGTAPHEGRIVDGTGPMVQALLRGYGLSVQPRAIVGDDAKGVRQAVREAAETADVVLTTGGTGPGEQDALRGRLEEDGVRFTEAGLRPGGRLGLGRTERDGALVVSLPGDPVAALVACEVVVLPLLARLAGRVHRVRTVTAVLGARITPDPVHERFVPVTLGPDAGGGWLATPTGDAEAVSAVSRAHGLARVPAVADEDPSAGVVGGLVHVLPLVDLRSVGDTD